MEGLLATWLELQWVQDKWQPGEFSGAAAEVVLEGPRKCCTGGILVRAEEKVQMGWVPLGCSGQGAHWGSVGAGVG